jgi:hypothetical protein
MRRIEWKSMVGTVEIDAEMRVGEDVLFGSLFLLYFP